MNLVIVGTTICLSLGGCASGNRSPQDLVTALAGEDAVESYRILERTDDPGAQKGVVAGLSDPNARVRSQCARIIGRWNDVAFVDVLKPLLHDRALVVRREAARALVRLLDTDQVLQILVQPQFDVRGKVEMSAWLLRDPSELGHQDFFQWLIDPGHDLELRVALLGLVRDIVSREFKEERSSAPEVAPLIVERRAFLAEFCRTRALDEQEPETLRCSALEAYAALAREQSVEDLLGLLAQADHSYRFRDAILTALGHSRSKQAVSPLCKVFRDGSKPLSSREAALLGLRFLWEDPVALETVKEALHDSDPRMRLTAVKMTKELTDGPLRPLLEEVLSRELNAQVAEELSQNLNRGWSSRRKKNGR